MSDDASEDSDTEGVGLSTAMFISGPTGVGKTAMVYACAEELGYKVLLQGSCIVRKAMFSLVSNFNQIVINYKWKDITNCKFLDLIPPPCE